MNEAEGYYCKYRCTACKNRNYCRKSIRIKYKKSLTTEAMLENASILAKM